MDLDRKTTFLGKGTGRLGEHAIGLTKREMNQLLNASTEDFKLSWRLTKATDLVVLGTKPDEEQVARARAESIETMDARDWLGASAIPEATTVYEYLAQLNALYTVTEHTSVGDARPAVARIEIVTKGGPVHTSARHYAEVGTHSSVSPPVADAIVGWVRSHLADALAMGPGPRHPVSTAPGAVDFVSKYVWPCDDAETGFWATVWGPFARSGAHGPITAMRDREVVTAVGIQSRLLRLGAPLGVVSMRFFDSADLDAVHKVCVVGAVEKDGAHVSILVLPVVHA